MGKPHSGFFFSFLLIPFYQTIGIIWNWNCIYARLESQCLSPSSVELQYGEPPEGSCDTLCGYQPSESLECGGRCHGTSCPEHRPVPPKPQPQPPPVQSIGRPNYSCSQSSPARSNPSAATVSRSCSHSPASNCCTFRPLLCLMKCIVVCMSLYSKNPETRNNSLDFLQLSVAFTEYRKK